MTELTAHIRADFPLLQHTTTQGHGLCYLDNAATTHKPQVVIDRLARFYAGENAPVHRGAYGLAMHAFSQYDAARSRVATFIQSVSPQQIVFTRGATEGINLVAERFLLPRLKPGMNVLVSAMEHHANFLPWQRICRLAGAALRIIPLTPQGALDMKALAELIDEKTAMLALTHMSNVLGTLTPIPEILALAKQQGVPSLIDAAQSAAYYPIRVSDWDCDFLVFSGHKLFAPTGIGVLYGKAEHWERMEPHLLGGRMVQRVEATTATYQGMPHKFEAGTPNVGGAIALATAMDYLEQWDRTQIRQHLKALVQKATKALQSVEGLSIYGSQIPKGSVLSFSIEGIHPHDLATFLNERGIAVRAGHHCAQPLMRYLGVPATTRASFAMYNTLEEVDRLVEGVKAAQAFFL